MNIEKINELFKCKFCNEIYKNPIILSCGHRICRKDLSEICVERIDEVTKDLTKVCCHLCHEEMIVPEKGFLVDKDFSIFTLASDFKGIDFGTKYKRSRRAVNGFQKEIQSLESLMNDTNCYIAGYFSILKQQIICERDELNKEIYKHYANLYDEVEAIEVQCRSREISKSLEKMTNDIVHIKENAKLLSNELDSTIKVDEKKWEDIAFMANFQKLKLSRTISDLKNDLTQNSLYNFVSNKKIIIDYVKEARINCEDYPEIKPDPFLQVGVREIVVSNFKKLCEMKNSQFESSVFDFNGYSWSVRCVNNGGDNIECFLRCHGLDSSRTLNATYLFENSHPRDILKNKWKIKRSHFKHGELSAGWKLITNDIFEEEFYDEKTDSITINVCIQIDKIKD